MKFLYNCRCGQCSNVTNPEMFELQNPGHIKSFGFSCTQEQFDRMRQAPKYQAHIYVIDGVVRKNRFGYDNITVEQYNALYAQAPEIIL